MPPNQQKRQRTVEDGGRIHEANMVPTSIAERQVTEMERMIKQLEESQTEIVTTLRRFMTTEWSGADTLLYIPWQKFRYVQQIALDTQPIIAFEFTPRCMQAYKQAVIASEEWKHQHQVS
eukprot:jgi/Chlat1/7685/Chrsp64S07178